MRAYPYPIKSEPDVRSPARYLLWLGGQQGPTLATGVLYGSIWMLTQALVPFALGRAIDAGILGKNFGSLLQWTGVLVGLAIVQSVFAVLRHRTSISNWLQAALRSIQLVGHKITYSGDALPRTFSTGEVVSTAASDAMRIGQIYDITARLAGSVLSYLVVSYLVAQISPVLGLTVLIGVPVCCGLLLFIIGPLQRRQGAQREHSGRMTAIGADTVAGLRVLRGIGGEHIFVGRYKVLSQATRTAGNDVARSLATLQASQLLVTGGFAALFTWLGASLAVTGAIAPGQLVSLYGFAVFLVTPVRNVAEAVAAIIRAVVGARKVIKVLSTPALVASTADACDAPELASPLRDTLTGVEVAPGRLTAIVSADPALSADLAERLGRFDDDDLRRSEVHWGSVPLHQVDLGQVRQRIVFSEADPQLFTGTLRQTLDPQERHDDGDMLAALEAASASDILDGVENGLDHEVTERGRGFSGGQRQRLALARALLTEAETLLLVEPTSAVDAHTESRIASRLAAARQPGSTTVVVTASPLMLGVMDHIIFLDGGLFAAEGTHKELLRNAKYRDVVIRSE
ncbi:ABC transporter ATP-binding protein [Paenarthrobacter sp. Z7-10]|uniref:ABC transporter transmembrane domain-containing protein n=1 Tax=Paenarthrobacter sp. Z7-10 TaxID=2787635 RepID=UPI0022A988BD|nr:ABC transporter ATP-binding protein [Paenarthrobacter sp. Z7-10]MCZ2404343.1 ABC transporter ATP-binding protein [Paenarthrobacter sp. Z7-10]